MRSVFFFGLLTISLFNISAQSDFRPGYIITNSLDTIHGLVDYRGEMRNMKVCTFKESIEGVAKEFLPGDISGYRYNDTGKFFVTKKIDTEEFSDTVFVEFLLNGISNLYYYKNLNYSAYFIDSENSELLELRSKETKIKKNGSTFAAQDNKYLGVLGYALADCPEIRKDVHKTTLSHKSLIKITRKYHDYKCSDEACVIYEKEIPVLRVELKPTIGYAISGIDFKSEELRQVDFRKSSSAVAGLALNFIVPRWNEKLTFLVSLTFNKDYYYGTYFNQTSGNSSNSYYHINNSNLNSSISIKYTYPKYKFRPELFVGICGNSIVDSDTKIYKERLFSNLIYTFEENPNLFKKFNGGITGGLGAEYKLFNKLRAFSNFSFLYSISLNEQELETVFTSYRFSTGLTF